MAANGSSDDSGPYDSDPVARAAEIAEYGSMVFLQIAGRWYERAKEKSRWSAEDVVGDCTDLIEHLTPLLERSLELGIEALRPFARSTSAGTP
jgi:hypothetical protein